MPFEKIGPCPFTGTHWPSEWGDKKITPNTFSHILSSGQKKDLIEYFYEHESNKTSARSQPAYRFKLSALREYLGANTNDLRKTELQSKEYRELLVDRGGPARKRRDMARMRHHLEFMPIRSASMKVLFFQSVAALWQL